MEVTVLHKDPSWELLFPLCRQPGTSRGPVRGGAALPEQAPSEVMSSETATPPYLSYKHVMIP